MTAYAKLGIMSRTALKDFAKFLAQAVVAGLAIAFVLLWVFPELAATRPGPAQMQQTRSTMQPGTGSSYYPAVAAVAPAVVNIDASRLQQRRIHPLFQDPLFKRFFGEVAPSDRVDRNLGSGVILNSGGLLLTNAHIIKGSDEILVTLRDGRQDHASVLGVDTETDLAVLKLAKLADLDVAPTGNSDQVRVGDIVLAIGNPYGVGQTVTQGIVSATGRSRLGITTFEDFIQTDADINPGNSGGALINTLGQVIGINTAILTYTGGSQGIGFTIPINLAVDVVKQLVTYGRVIRGWLGIVAQVVPKDIIDAADLAGGILVAGVRQNSPAARAGIMPGDILTRINNIQLYHPQQAIHMIAGLRPGSMTEIHLLRGWEEIVIHANVAQRPQLIQ